MKKSKKLWMVFLCFSCFIISQASAEKIKPFFSGPLVFSQLSPGILHSRIFARAPATVGSIFQYRSVDLQDGKPYSNYQINVVKQANRLSHYRTIETPTDSPLPEVQGNGIGYGGIVSLAYDKGQTKSVNPPRAKWGKFHKKYEIVKIDNVSGKLFPLKVGNKVSFHYIAYNKFQNQLERWQGKMVYEVIKKLNRYAIASAAVPGPIYVVRLSRSVSGHSGLSPMNEYYFAPKLGWYVVAKYYRYGRVVAEYDLIKWS